MQVGKDTKQHGINMLSGVMGLFALLYSVFQHSPLKSNGKCKKVIHSLRSYLTLWGTEAIQYTIQQEEKTIAQRLCNTL